MNALTPTKQSLPAEVHHALAVALEPVERGMLPSGDPYVFRRELPRLDAAGRAAAAAEAGALDRTLRQPATAAMLRDWLRPINASCRNPQSAEDFALRVSAIAVALGEIPAAILNRETQAEAIRAWQWFPSGAEVLALLTPHAERLRSRRDALRRLAEPPPPPPAPAAPSEAERAAVAAKAEAFAAEMRARVGMAPGKPRVQPRHLSNGALIAAYERRAAGDGPQAEAARTRLAALRKHGAAA